MCEHCLKIILVRQNVSSRTSTEITNINEGRVACVTHYEVNFAFYSL